MASSPEWLYTTPPVMSSVPFASMPSCDLQVTLSVPPDMVRLPSNLTPLADTELSLELLVLPGRPPGLKPLLLWP